MSLNNLTFVLRLAGDLAGARACAEESLAIKRGRGDTRGIAFTLVNLAEVAIDAYARNAAETGRSRSTGV